MRFTRRGPAEHPSSRSPWTRRLGPGRTASRASAAFAALALVITGMILGTGVILGSGTILSAPAPAHAAPGDAFPVGDPAIYSAQGQASPLYRSVIGADGTITTSAVGAAVPFSYNVLAYRPADDYLYAIVSIASTGFPVGSLVRIGQEGVSTRVGTGIIAAGTTQTTGAVGANGNLYSMQGNSTTLYVTNPTTGSNVGTVALSQAPSVADFTVANGFLWGITNVANTTRQIVRISPVSGAVAVYALPVEMSQAAAYGGAWTFGNGNLGFSDTAGTVHQVAVTNPTATLPTFSVVAQNFGAPTVMNDASAAPGQATDLSIAKRGPVALTPGGQVTYSLTVTNAGPGQSSGHTISDVVPAPLSNVATTAPGCTVVGNTVRCLGARLAVGASVTYTIRASVLAGITAGVVNSATVTAYEADASTANNTSSSGSGIGRLALVKTAGSPVDVNADGLVDAGDTIAYTFDVTNTGTVALTAVVVDDPKIGAVSCAATTLSPGATMRCAGAAVYTITAADAASGSADNTATATGTASDGGLFTSTPSSTSTPVTTDAPAISLVKTADVATVSAAGQSITYSFLLTNTGNVPLSDVAVVEGDFSGTGVLGAIACPAEATTLAPSASATCTATYAVTQADIDAGTLTNAATGTGVPPAGTPPVSPPDEAVVDVVAEPAITLAKAATPTVVVSAGQVVTYNFLVANTGNVTVGGVSIAETGFSGTGTAPVASCPATALAPGATVTCTATYATTAADIDAGAITNTAVATATGPAGTPVTSAPSSAGVSVFRVTIPLTGGTSSDLVIAAGGSAVVVGLLVAIGHLRRLRRDPRRARLLRSVPPTHLTAPQRPPRPT
jgi:uncharacterized repeat protein (TIGR01451 family)